MPPRKRKLTPPGAIQSTPKISNPSSKIAILGAHPHWRQAPFDDPDWEVWGMSAGMWHLFPRWDLWFELHNPKIYQKYESIAARNGKKGYIDFITKEAVTYGRFPFGKLLEQFGPYFFTSGQITWLLAYAITLNPETIGMWGVEASREYSPQRKDIQHFIQVARDRGIKIVIPDGCTLLEKPKLYAYAPPQA